MSDKPFTNDRKPKDIQRLLASLPSIAGICELDLLTFFYRHPRTLLTNEQLAAFVGYDMKQIAKSVDVFVEAGLLERTQNAAHASRMYVLVIEGPQREELNAFLELALTRQGRRDILQVLDPGRFKSPLDLPHAKRRLHAIS